MPKPKMKGWAHTQSVQILQSPIAKCLDPLIGGSKNNDGS